MATLLENYAKRLQISESVYAKEHNGAKMDSRRKICTAQCLKNINSMMNEAFNNSVGTQQTAMGDFKKFTLNIATVALPNLIAHELVIVQPMASISGYVTYIQYTAGSNKGQTHQKDVFNSPFKLGDVNPNYTSANVVEAKDAGSNTKFGAVAWTPVVHKAFTYNNTQYDAKILVNGGASVTYAYIKDADGKVYTNAELTTEYQSNTADKLAYLYDNVIIPQNDIPTLNAEIKSIPLVAKARRISIYYSQLANFQAKQDYGMDLGEQLAEKAVGQLEYEIDTEVCDLLIANATEATELVWSKTLPIGVSKQEHYEGFAEVVELAKQKIFDATKKFTPNYMLIASNVLPVIAFIKGFTPAPAGKINGPYFAGTLNGVKVFVTPHIEAGKFVFGVNGDDLMSSAAVYAPYMAVIPTQLMQYADGGTTQGFSTMYALEMLNPLLLTAGRITA